MTLNCDIDLESVKLSSEFCKTTHCEKHLSDV